MSHRLGLAARLSRAVTYRWQRFCGKLAERSLHRSFSRKGWEVHPTASFLGRPIVTVVEGGKLQIGEGTVFCSDSNLTALGVRQPVVLRVMSKDAELIIGTGSKMSGTTICAATSVQIGARAMIGSGVIITDTDFHSLDPGERNSSRDFAGASKKAVCIGDDVFLGGGSMILKGVSIGDGAIVAAGAIVTKSVDSLTIVGGNPAKYIGPVPLKQVSEE